MTFKKTGHQYSGDVLSLSLLVPSEILESSKSAKLVSQTKPVRPVPLH